MSISVLLVNPPFKPDQGKFSREQRSPAITKSGTFYYPMWLCYAAGVLEKNGFTVRLIDAPAKQLEFDTVLQMIVDFAPDLLVIDTSTPSIINDVDFAAKAKRLTGAYTTLVGPHPSALPKETLLLNEAIDAVARREYEYIILELARAIEAGQLSINGLSKIDGLTFRTNNDIISNNDRDYCEDLDSLPFVSEIYNKHLDYKDYFYAHSKHPIITLINGRGCPFKCVYCLYPQTFNGHKVRYRSIKNVVDEIEYCIKTFPDLQEIMFEDDTLTVDKKRSRELAEEIIRRGINIQWSANSRADVDLETMQILKRAGARLFCVGIESGDQAVLDNMKKNMNVERIKQFFKDAKKAGIMIHGCFLVGNPGETKDTLQKTLDLALELNPDTAQFFPIMVYPGTAAYKWATESEYLTTTDFKEWLTADGLHNCVLSRPGLTNFELVKFCDDARKKFYIRPTYIVRKFIQGLSDAHEMKRLVMGGKTLVKYIFKRSGTSCDSDKKSC